MRRSTIARRLAVLYFALQAILIAVWWIVLWLVPAARAPFVVADWPAATMLAFWPADLLLLVLGSAFAAWTAHRHRAAAPRVASFVAGAAVYATLYCVGATLLTGAGLLPTAMMLMCGVGTVAAAMASGAGP